MFGFHAFCPFVIAARPVTRRAVDDRNALNRAARPARNSCFAISRSSIGPGRHMETVAVAASGEELSVPIISGGFSNARIKSIFLRDEKGGQISTSRAIRSALANAGGDIAARCRYRGARVTTARRQRAMAAVAEL